MESLLRVVLALIRNLTKESLVPMYFLYLQICIILSTDLHNYYDAHCYTISSVSI
jgi:hypothetical protein